MTDPNRDCGAECERYHEHRGSKVDCNLVRGGNLGAARAHQEGNRVEKACFGGDRYRDRYTQRQDLPKDVGTR